MTITFDGPRILVRAESADAAREIIPDVRVIEKSHAATTGELGIYEAPAAPRTIRAIGAMGYPVPDPVRADVAEWMRQIRQIAALRARIYEGALPDLSMHLQPEITMRRVQHVGALIALTAPRTALYMDMGTGKTLTALVAAAHRFEHHGLRRVLVIAPATVAGGWKNDIQMLAMRGQTEFVHALGSQARRKRVYDRAHLVGNGDDYMSVVAVSYGTIANDANEIIRRFQPQCVIVDESHYIKNATSSRSKAVQHVCDAADFVQLLTGTPYSEQPTDVFSQYTALDWRVFGASRDAFIEKFCSSKPNYAASEHARPGDDGAPVLPVKVKVGDEHQMGLLSSAIYTIGFRARKEDVLDLPEKHEPIRHEVELSVKTKRVIKDLRAQGLAQLDNMEAMGQPVTAATRMVIGLRVQQAAGGFAKVGDGDDAVTVQIGSEKLDSLRDLVTSMHEEHESVVVFARFRPEIDAIEERLARVYGKANVSRIDGSVPVGKRSDVVAAFQAPGGPPRAMVLQISSGAAGITLTRARHTIYFSMGYSATDYWQSLDRTHRIGQDRACFYHVIEAVGSDDRVTLASLEGKTKIADAVIESWRADAVGEPA